MIKDYQTFLRESLQGVALTVQIGNYIEAIDPEANFWFQQTPHIEEYKKFYDKAKDVKEDGIPAMIQKAQELDLFKTTPSDIWDVSRIMKTEHVRTDKDCYLWMKDYVVTVLQLYIKWAENKQT